MESNVTEGCLASKVLNLLFFVSKNYLKIPKIKNSENLIQREC